MKTHLSVLCALLLILASACSREKHATLSGRLLQNCSGQPSVNETVSLYRAGYDGYTMEKLGETKTDANGNFKISYSYKGHKSTILIAGGQKLRGIPAGTPDVGNIIIERVAQSVVKVKVNNSYASEDDAIHVRYSGPPYFSMHTPFHDTIFPVYAPVITDDPPSWNPKHPYFATHTAMWSFTNGSLPDGYRSIDVDYCNTVPDTIVITID